MIRPGTIRLGNKRSYSDHKPEAGELVIDIDRPHPLSNPFIVNAATCRATAVFAFKIEFESEMKRKEGPRYREICRIADLLIEGNDVILMCWCAPNLLCHGEVIVDWVNRLVAERQPRSSKIG